MAACGTCHELPPPIATGHPETDGLSCASCHGAVVDADNTIIDETLHINGKVEVSIEGHPTGWLESSSDDFHGQAIRTAGWDMTDCQRCHGSDYAGGITQSSCLTCHPSTPEDCSVCHGSDVNSAPPQDTHANSATSFIGVGAHQAHLLDSDLTTTLACAECHTVPSSFADPAHIDGDGKAELIWGSVATTDNATPQFDDQTATCASVYCHGDQSVVWTEVGTDQAACGTCHELPPGGDHPVTNDLSCANCHGTVVNADNTIVDKTLHINGKVEVTMAACGTCHELPPPIATGHPETDGLSCASCHGAVVDADNTIIDETLHINGKVEVAIEGHPTGWLESSSDDFHGQAIRTAGWDMTDCQRCHGSDYAGGITQSSCLTCHPSTPEDCSVCHGSDVNSAPPQDTHANSATSFIGVGAHQAHLLDSDLTATLACAECHTVPSSFADPVHIDGDGKAELIWGTVAKTGGAAPQFDDQTATCASIYCHGDQSVVWTEVGTDQAACGTCHELPPGGDHPETNGLSCASCHGTVVDADNTIIDRTLHINGKVEVAIEGHPIGWLESSSDDFHGQAIRTAGWDMTDCQRCHGSDYAGGITQSSCLTCHPSTPEDCSVCHGSDVNSAPPQDTHANSATSFIGVGAHQAHLLDSNLTSTLACAECHTVPASFADPAHIDGDGKAELSWGSVATTGDVTPQFDDQTATCASIYCHGDQSVVWTEVGTDQAACGTCHELPPGGDHPETNGLSCASCHGAVVDADNTIIDKTLHINGKVEVSIEGHPTGWLESSSDDFHGQAIRTAGWDMTDCQRCHGSDYAGGITQSSCLTCHPSTPEDCSVCHGSDVNSAPPQDTHANSATSFIGVGAHQAHLLDSDLTATLACAECHTVPSTFSDPAHIDGDGKAELIWGSVATTDNATPQFDDQTATCASVYCHGDQSVIWTEVGTDQAACGTCHELPPGGDHPETNGLSCASCHGAVVDADNTIIDRTLHINGKVEVAIEGHPTGWLESSSDDFHGQAIRTAGWDMTDCQRCHGNDYAGGITQSSCLTCHPSTPEDCSVCHGSDVNSAPPQDTHTNTATSFIGVGAHQAHLLDSDLTTTLACAECHTVPSSFADPAHIDGDGKAELIWGTVATTDNATPQFDDQTATCASIYCHGDQSVVWTEVGTDQAACGTCHELPPGGDHPETDGLSCASCHGTVVDADNTIIDKTLHINGKTDVTIEGHPTGWLDTSSDDFHGQAIRAAGWDMTDCQRCHGSDYAGGITQSSCLTCHPSTPEDCSVCHGSDVNSAPPQDTHANSATSFIGVGAHQAHLLDSNLTTTLACAECHTVPSSFADPAHIDGDGKAELSWGSVAKTGGAAPQFDDQTTTCASVYCHGDQSVVWTEVGTDQAACGTCHELPPGGDHPETNGLSCTSCHSAVVDADNTIIDRTLHINGKVEVTIEGHPTGWLESSSDDFHGQAIRTAGWDMTDCQSCHGSDYAGGIAQVSCLTCHENTPEDCSVCHGSDVNSAPPQDTHANSATNFIGVGAHQAHLLDSNLTSALACAECHTVPASFADPAHIDGDGKAELIWGSVAKTGGAAPQFDDQTGGCAGTYCHSGGKFGTNPVPVWTEVGTDQAACGTCHELPPSTATGHPAILDGVSCITCHRTVVDADLAIIDKSLHMNGTTEATCATCHTLPPSGDHPQEPTQCSLCHSNVIDANFEFINEALHNNGQTNF